MSRNPVSFRNQKEENNKLIMNQAIKSQVEHQIRWREHRRCKGGVNQKVEGWKERRNGTEEGKRKDERENCFPPITLVQPRKRK